MSTVRTFALGVTAALLAAAILWHAAEVAGAAPAEDARTVLYWYDPMRPDVHFDAPGKSPFMDMQLVPKYAEAAADTGVVTIDARMVQSLGIRTAPVTRGTFWQRVDATGRITTDENRLYAVTVRASGWVERLHVRTEAEFVRAGELVAEIYSPEIDAAQREYALARRSARQELIDAARDQLVALGIDAEQIAALDGGGQQELRIRLRAPRTGYAMRLAAREGGPVAPDKPLFEIAGHDRLWLIVAVPEVQSSWITEGKSAEVRLPALPGTTLEGTVDYLYPEIDETTRTQPVRIVLPNPGDVLHPGMYADVTLYGGGRRDVLLVPTDAVIRTGTRDVVIVAEADDRFRPVEVRLGPERGDNVVVLGGLDEGQRVVTSGQFLIDSEASLRGAFRRMSSGDDHGATP